MGDKSSGVGPSTLLYAETDRRIIAVDLDDVLCQTNQAVADCERFALNDSHELMDVGNLRRQGTMGVTELRWFSTIFTVSIIS